MVWSHFSLLKLVTPAFLQLSFQRKLESRGGVVVLILRSSPKMAYYLTKLETKLRI